MILTGWKLIVPSLVLIYLGYSLGGFFKINYVIGGIGFLLGVWQLANKKV